ncbi:CotH kinase family protein [Pseudobdellovibrio sp. HCB154]|uniref:CotH kinase family protein n=1 Tax=Pseudobdellovibrio sp. HCB154 TaxID=3386277 RepID=UPI003916F787
MTQRFKKGLLLGLAQISFVTSAFAYDAINLNVQTHDLAHYKDLAEKYEFAPGQLQLNREAPVNFEALETRGQGSISYSRRNFGIKLEAPIRVGRVESKKLDLLSMSADAGYISTRLGLLTAEALQIGTPLPTAYFELFLNGKSNGLYLAVEKPKSAMNKSPYVVRRGYKSRFDHDGAEVSKKLTLSQTEEIKAVADSIYTDIATKTGETLFNSLKSKMDIDAYMRWMAMNSLYTNGDFPDEIFFFADSEMYKQGKIYFRVTPWDTDDLFKAMHNVPINATEAAKPENMKSILYSYEDKLDRAFAPVNAYMYEQFKATTRTVITKLNQDVTDGMLRHIYSELQEYLTNQNVLTLSGKDSGRKGVMYTKSEIENIFLKRKKQIDERRAILLERVK